jgi:hypothetical protein
MNVNSAPFVPSMGAMAPQWPGFAHSTVVQTTNFSQWANCAEASFHLVAAEPYYYAAFQPHDYSSAAYFHPLGYSDPFFQEGEFISDVNWTPLWVYPETSSSSSNDDSCFCVLMEPIPERSLAADLVSRLEIQAEKWARRRKNLG